MLDDRMIEWDLDSGTTELVQLEKPIRGVCVTPSAPDGVIDHTLEDVPAEEDSYTDQFVITLFRYSAGSLESNSVPLADPRDQIVHADTGQGGFFAMSDNPYLGLLLNSWLLVKDVLLESPAVHVGVVPGDSDLGWAAQDHPDGRISIIDTAEAEAQTITGLRP